MPAFIPTPADYFLVNHIIAYAGKRYSIGYYITHLSSVIAWDPARYLDHAADSFANHYWTHVASQHYDFVESILTDTSVQDGPQETTTAHTFTTGSSDLGMPPEVALVISLRTGQRGRSMRGRMYIPGIHSTAYNTAEASWDETFLTAHQALVDDWRSDSQSSVLGEVPPTQWQVASKHHNGAPRSVALMTPVTSAPTNPQPCSQRRRQTQHHGRLR